jgi:diguanylate cyclase (GGDEF)-like protein
MTTHRNQDVVLPAGFLNDLSTAQDQREVVEVANRWLAHIVPSERSSIALVTDDQSRLEVHAVGENFAIDSGKPLPISETLIGQCFRERKPINVAELATVGKIDTEALVAGGLQSTLLAPLVAGDQCLGTLNVASARKGFFRDSDRDFLSSAASLIAAFMRIHQQVHDEQERARTDPLTGELNRFAIVEVLDGLLSAESRLQPSVLYIDMDGFKAINDGHGHHVGDEVLRQTVARIREIAGPAHAIGRLGGDEVLVVVSNDTNCEIARSLADQIVQRCAAPVRVDLSVIEPRLSIGIASPHLPGMNVDAVLVQADQAMYVAKSSEDWVVVADDTIRARAEMLRVVDSDLDEALANGEVSFHYQPVRNIETGVLESAEALLRWNHPTLGPIPPPLLIEQIDITGRTVAFTKWCINTIGAQWKQLQKTVPERADMRVAINLTANQLQWSNYAEAHMAMLERTGLRARDVIVEVVESEQITEGDPAEATLRELASKSVFISLDDFGTGHNALRYFAMFPIHEIKFDRSLISNIVDNDMVRSIVAGMCRIANSLGVQTLAEGIETEAELQLCKDLKFLHGQGYLLGRPMPFDSFVELAAGSTFATELAA